MCTQADAARDLAQIRLAEQIIQEKERHIQEEEYRVDITLMEKEALAEELVNLKSRKTLEAVSRDEAVMSPTSMSKVCVHTCVCVYVSYIYMYLC